MKKIATVVGLGVSGYGATLILLKKGWRVRITEEADTPEIREKAKRLGKEGDCDFEIGAHTRGFIKGASLVVTSPGARDESKPLVWAKELNIPVVDEIELGYRFCPGRIIAVTGTNGKSTTTALIGEILKAGGYDVAVCGNIGYSFCEKLAGVKKETVVVLEISSFQLQRIDRFRPYVSLFLNITQNHLDRHRDFEEYLNAKLNIFKNQKKTDWAILNYDDTRLKALGRHIAPRILYFGNSENSADLKGAFFKDDAICLNNDEKSRRVISVNEITLKGAHNLKNSMAAVLAASIFKVEPEVIKRVLKNFKGLEHRFEYAGEIEGVRFINDSKATTVDAAMCAIRSIEKPVILIAGGRDKGSDFTVLRDLVRERAKALVLIGEAKKKIKTQLSGTAPIYEVRDLNAAVFLSFDLASSGDTVLLSPMCASFDMFKCFEERGECFKKTVAALRGKYTLTETCTRICK